MSGEEIIIHKYKGFEIETTRCSYPSYRVDLDVCTSISGVKKLKTIKRMIDVYLEGDL